MKKTLTVIIVVALGLMTWTCHAWNFMLGGSDYGNQLQSAIDAAIEAGGEQTILCSQDTDSESNVSPYVEGEYVPLRLSGKGIDQTKITFEFQCGVTESSSKSLSWLFLCNGPGFYIDNATVVFSQSAQSDKAPSGVHFSHEGRSSLFYIGVSSAANVLFSGSAFCFYLRGDFGFYVRSGTLTINDGGFVSSGSHSGSDGIWPVVDTMWGKTIINGGEFHGSESECAPQSQWWFWGDVEIPPSSTARFHNADVWVVDDAYLQDGAKLVRDVDSSGSYYYVTNKSPVIANLKVTQIAPIGLALDYEVEGVSDMVNELALEIKAITDGGAVTNVAKTLSGDVGCVDGAHRVYWNMAKDGLSFDSTTASLTVAYNYYPRYCVIDLEDGAEATTYPISYLASEPEGGFTNDTYKTTKLVLKRVDAGSFIMGEDQTSAEALTNHEVTLSKSFYMGLFEVTQKQWSLVMGTNPSHFLTDGDKMPVEQVSYNDIRGSVNGANWPSSNAVDGESGVGSNDSFLGRLRKRTGIKFDLPTEAQWEYTCRAGTTTKWSFGDAENLASSYIWYAHLAGAPQEVGKLKANPWGFYDMHGNVSEWCLDGYGDLVYASDPAGSSSGSDRVLRGGCFMSETSSSCSSFYRSAGAPSQGHDFSGFRLARTLQSPVDAGAASVSVDFSLGRIFADGSEIDGPITIGYAPQGPIDEPADVEMPGNDAVVTINGEVFVEASRIEASGSQIWMPTKGGAYTLKHIVGDIAIEATYTVPSRPIILRCEWNDFDNVLGGRPSAVSVTVYTNDVAYKTVSVSSNENWKARITLDSLADDVALSCWMASDVKGYSSSVERYEYDRLADVKLSNSVLTRTGWHEWSTLLLENDIYTEDGWEMAADVKLGKACVVKSNGIGEFFVITNQQTSEPGDNEILDGGLSKFDTIVDYDGKGHTIKTNELQTAFSEILMGECVFEYAAGDADAAVAGATALPWQTDAPAYTNVGEYVVWYKVTNSNYTNCDFVHAAKVMIKPRAIDPSEIFGGSERDDQGRIVCERVYNGAAQPFAVTPDFDEPYRLSYALVSGDESAYSETAPTRTHVAEGDLVVYFKFVSTNYEPYYGVGVLRIAAKTLTDEMCVADEDAAWFYDGTEKKPAVTVVDGSPNIATTNDYTLTYSGRTGAGLFPVTVTGTNDYAGVITKEFAIMKRPVVPPTIPSTSYNGRTRKATVPKDERWEVVSNPGGVDVGAYTNVVLKLTNPDDYRWKGLDEDEEEWTGVLVIVRGPNGWSRLPGIDGWTEGETASEPNLGQPRNGAVSKVLYFARGADVATATETQPTKAGLYTARFVVEETSNYVGTTCDVDFEIAAGAGGDAKTHTETTGEPVPYTWLEPYLAKYGAGDYEAAGNATGANGVALWESYVAGLDPDDATSQFRAYISVDSAGVATVTWQPDLSDDATPRVYTTYGKADLRDAAWTVVTDVNKASMRFFKVEVKMK